MKGYIRAISVTAVVTAAIVIALMHRSNAKAAGPYYYGCTPAAVPLNYSAGGYKTYLFVYNPNATTVTVFRKLLNNAGTNVSGASNPAGGNFPGESGSNTITVAPGTTAGIEWQNGGGDPINDAATVAAVKIRADLPVSTGMGVILGNNPYSLPCDIVFPF
jgi:hypothetical protein